MFDINRIGEKYDEKEEKQLKKKKRINKKDIS